MIESEGTSEGGLPGDATRRLPEDPRHRALQRLGAGAHRLTRRFSDAYERIYATVARIPRGRVATYGQVAALAGLPRRPRQVGYALHALDESREVPWHRVVNAEGRISLRAEPIFAKIQRRLLEHEGVRFDAGGRIELERFQWRPRGR